MACKRLYPRSGAHERVGVHARMLARCDTVLVASSSSPQTGMRRTFMETVTLIHMGNRNVDQVFTGLPLLYSDYALNKESFRNG